MKICAGQNDNILLPHWTSNCLSSLKCICEKSINLQIKLLLTENVTTEPKPLQTVIQQPTSLSIGKSPSEGAPHADISILQVLKHQVTDRDGLAINLEAAPVVPGHWSWQNQELREEEHVQPLWRDPLILNNESYCTTIQMIFWSLFSHVGNTVIWTVNVKSYRATFVPQLTVTM